jgi:hypothetical protein
MKNILIAVAAVVIIAGGGWYASSHGLLGKGVLGGIGGSKIVATVNGQSIPQAAYDRMQARASMQYGLNPASTTPEQAAQLKKQILDSLTGQELLRQAAQKAGITASTTGVETQIAAVKKQLGDDANFKKALAEQKMSEADLRKQIETDLMIREYLNQKLNLGGLSVTEDEIKQLYTQLSQGQQGVPPLKDVHDQVKQMALQQKQQQLITAHVDELRAAANIKVLI